MTNPHHTPSPRPPLIDNGRPTRRAWRILAFVPPLLLSALLVGGGIGWAGGTYWRTHHVQPAVATTTEQETDAPQRQRQAGDPTEPPSTGAVTHNEGQRAQRRTNKTPADDEPTEEPTDEPTEEATDTPEGPATEDAAPEATEPAEAEDSTAATAEQPASDSDETTTAPDDSTPTETRESQSGGETSTAAPDTADTDTIGGD
jgi:hypothetical protein